MKRWPATPAGPGARLGARAAWLLGVAAVLCAGLIGIGRLLVATAPGFDVDVVRWMAEHRSDRLDRISATVTDLVSTEMVIGLGLLAAVVAAAVLRTWWPAALMVIALVGELAVFLLTAAVVGRARPPVAPVGGVLPPTSSFPSGHTAATVCLYGGIAAIVVITTRGWWRGLVVVAVVLLVPAVAVSRVYRGAHHPTDVVAGALLGVLWLLTTVRAVRPAPVPRRAGGGADDRGVDDADDGPRRWDDELSVGGAQSGFPAPRPRAGDGPQRPGHQTLSPPDGAEGTTPGAEGMRSLVTRYRADGDAAVLHQLRLHGGRVIAHALTMERLLPADTAAPHTAVIDAWLAGISPPQRSVQPWPTGGSGCREGEADHKPGR